MRCAFCGCNIVDDACFCSYCGQKIIISTSDKNYYVCVKQYFEEIVPDNIDISSYFNPIKKNNIRDIFYQFCGNLQDYNMMPSVIGFLRSDRTNMFKDIFYDYDYKKVIEVYNADSLFEKFCDVFPVKNRDSKNNLWRRYAKSVIDAGYYLDKYKTADAFNQHIEKYAGNFDIVYDMSKNISGMGFALACNMVKDLGFTDYAKPDTHTKDVIEAMGYASDDITVIKAIQDIAVANGDTAFNFDRMIWLVCSGYYFNDNIRIGSHKKELISRIMELRRC